MINREAVGGETIQYDLGSESSAQNTKPKRMHS